MTRTLHAPRRTPSLGAGIVILLGVMAVSLHAQQFSPPRQEQFLPQAPPPTPPLLAQEPIPLPLVEPSAPGGRTLYSIGQPTAEEQFYLELINRARANPAAEGILLRDTSDPAVRAACNYFNVDLSLMASQFAALPAAPPLSFNANLIAAARGHTADMFTNAFQDHQGSTGSDLGSRANRAGYSPWTSLGENVFAYARGAFHGHAGFEVDWGYGTGGMQTPPGHRVNIHRASYREIGIGVINGVNGLVGPQLVTQDFGTRSGLTPFLTGVAYYDLNGNQFYDPGEGLGGVAVTVSGSGYHALTANSGGYSVPVPGNGTYVVTFASPGLSNFSRTVLVSFNANAKLDFIPAYSAPLISGPATALMGISNVYSFTPVSGAGSYQWRQGQRTPLVAVEGAEAGARNFAAAISTGYAPIAHDVRASGLNSFHLCHPQPADQSLTLNHLVRPGASAQMVFASRLGWAATGQVARVQFTTNAGTTWMDLWSQAGIGSGGQTIFSRVTNSLRSLAGQEIQLRFVYALGFGAYYNQTSAGFGWYFDDLAFVDCEALVNTTLAGTTNTAFAFQPAVATNYLLRVRAMLGDRFLDWGPALPVNAGIAAPLRARIQGLPVISAGRATFQVKILSGIPDQLGIETAPTPHGPWLADATATWTPIVAGSKYRATCAAHAAGRVFYRVAVR